MPFVVAFAILVLLLPPMVPSAMAQPVDVSSGDRVETLLRVFPNGLMPEQADAVLGVMGEAELRRVLRLLVGPAGTKPAAAEAVLLAAYV